MNRILFFLIFGLSGAAILIGLGVWQVQRLGWKQDVLAQIESRVAAAPVPLSAPALTAPAARYMPVTVQGRFRDSHADDHLRALASRRNIGAVYRIIRPFQTENMGLILVDTGWLRSDAPLEAVPLGPIQLTGNLDRPNEIDKFTPSPEADSNVLFARDVDYMAERLGTQPVMVVLRDMPQTDLGVTPWPVDAGNIPNNHLQYALTWFSLAFIWVAMTAYFLTRGLRAKPE